MYYGKFFVIWKGKYLYFLVPKVLREDSYIFRDFWVFVGGGNRKIVKSPIFLNKQRKVGLLQIDTQSVKLVGFVNFFELIEVVKPNFVVQVKFFILTKYTGCSKNFGFCQI